MLRGVCVCVCRGGGGKGEYQAEWDCGGGVNGVLQAVCGGGGGQEFCSDQPAENCAFQFPQIRGGAAE
jgi:hypothetical protein